MDKETSSDSLGERVKYYEKLYASQAMEQDKPICVRIDGKAFHTYTKGLARPYDARLSNAMVETMAFLVESTQARLGYTQSDEISLVYFNTAAYQQSYFGARVQKLASILASMATAKFNSVVAHTIKEKSETMAFFDARVWSVPSLKDAAEVFVWRQEDAIKNAVSMAAQAYFSHKQLLGKKSADKISMLAAKGVDWESYPEFFKSGTYAARKKVLVPVSSDMSQYSSNQGKEYFERHIIEKFYLPRLSRVNCPEELLFSSVLKKELTGEDRPSIEGLKSKIF